MLSKLAAGQAWRDDPVTHWTQPVSRYVESEKVPGSLAVPYWRGLSRRRHRPGVRGVYKWMQQFQYVDHRTLNDVMAWQLP